MDKMRYTIIAFASPDIQKKLIELRKQIGISFNMSSENKRVILKDTAHVAIKRTFFLKKNQEEKELAKRISALFTRDSILIRCSESGVFSDTAYGEVVYVKVDYNSQLEKLHLNIKQKIDDIVETKDLNTEGKKYVPHITLAYGVPKEKISEAQQYINTKILPCDFYIQKIVLLRDCDAEKDKREIIAIYNLV